jgi:Domain of unknown function (DUF1707)
MMSQQGPELRIGDAEREAAVAALGEHYAAGRLTKDEYDERSAQAWEARTSSALWPLFAALPRPEAPRPTGPSGPSGYRSAGGRGQAWGRGRSFGWVLPLLLVLGVLTAITHLPLIVVGLVVWLLWSNLGRRRWSSRHWSHHGRYYR